MSTPRLRWVIGTGLLFGALVASVGAQVPYQRLLKAESDPQNWLTYAGSLQVASLLGARSNQPAERLDAQARVGVSDPAGRHRRDVAARCRRRHVPDRAAEHRHCARRSQRPAALDLYAEHPA